MHWFRTVTKDTVICHAFRERGVVCWRIVLVVVGELQGSEAELRYVPMKNRIALGTESRYSQSGIHSSFKLRPSVSLYYMTSRLFSVGTSHDKSLRVVIASDAFIEN